MAESRDTDGTLSFPPPLFYILHSNTHICSAYTHTHTYTSLLPPPSPHAAFWIKPLWFATSHCMRHELMENYSRVIVFLGFAFEQQKFFLARVGGTPACKKGLLSSQNALSDDMLMSFL